MDSKYLAEMYKHLEKQSEALMESYRSMTHELRRLKVEEEMLMRKFYEYMTAEGLAKKNKSGENDSFRDDTNTTDSGHSQSTALVCQPSNES